MALITTADIAPFRPAIGSEYRRGHLVTKASAKLSQIVEAEEKAASHDIFLSHKASDAEQLVALYALLKSLGYTVYVDWKDDPQLDRSHVTSAAASTLRYRMGKSKCLFFATTTTAGESKWMPWELGYKDGENGKVAICPVVAAGGQGDFKGQEYLGIYPYVDKTGSTLYIHHSASKYVRFDNWLRGSNIPE